MLLVSQLLIHHFGASGPPVVIFLKSRTKVKNR